VTHDLVALCAGFVIATVTAPVGVSGAVFLLPVQMNLLGVPNPQLTPTNLLYNVISGPGALVRYLRHRQLDTALTRALVLGSAPGVVIGAWLRVHVASDPAVFRVVAAVVLVPTGLFILARPTPPRSLQAAAAGARTDSGGRSLPRLRTISGLAFLVGVVGGVYGIGGGSILGPLLVGSGMAVARVAPAALASTFVTSVIGVAAFALLALDAPGSIAPDWSLGIAAGLGGLAGGYTGARLQPRLPERVLRRLLGILAIALGAAYLVQAIA
jgi:uncharacterized membrane protein YfcA